MSKANQHKETTQMSDVDTEVQGEAPPAGEEAAPVTPEDMIQRGVGLSQTAIDALPEDSPVKGALAEFRQLVDRHKQADALAEELKDERNSAVYVLKSTHDVGFSALAEIMGNTSSMALYIYERAQGKTAKQIRDESVRSRLAKEQFRETDPNRKPVRKQSAEEKDLRKRQREELKKFLADQRAAGVEVEDLEPDDTEDDT